MNHVFFVRPGTFSPCDSDVDNGSVVIKTHGSPYSEVWLWRLSSLPITVTTADYLRFYGCWGGEVHCYQWLSSQTRIAYRADKVSDGRGNRHFVVGRRGDSDRQYPDTGSLESIIYRRIRRFARDNLLSVFTAQKNTADNATGSNAKSRDIFRNFYPRFVGFWREIAFQVSIYIYVNTPEKDDAETGTRKTRAAPQTGTIAERTLNRPARG